MRAVTSTFVLILLLATGFQVGACAVVGLRCEHQCDPLGIDVVQPRMSWLLDSTERNQRQTAYRILVASSLALLEQNQGDLWDSGKVESHQSVLVPYAGRLLGSHQQAFWMVQVWDSAGKPSAWSAPARWTMGILAPSEWQAQWIVAKFPEQQTPKSLPIFRREFRLAKPLRRAVAYVCGLGHYELYLNGDKVGDRMLDPPWTNYRKTCIYATYDVTDRIASGPNALGVMLGNGMYNVAGGRYTKFKGSFGQPQFILHLRLEYADGSAEQIVSDSSWRTTEGPIVFSCVYGGEDYNAQLEPRGWLRPGFDDSKWWPAVEIAGPGGRLRATAQQAVKAVQVFKPVAMTEGSKGVTIDFGQNSAAVPVVRLRGPSGAKVKISTGEGPVAGGWNGTWFTYTLKGGGEETFRPRFTSWGHRSLLVEGATLDAGSEKPILLGAQALSIRCSAPLTGSIQTSDELLNRIYHIILWSIHSNFQSVLTDCPHREKLGWLEVSHLMAPSIMYTHDAAGFYNKIQDDMAEAQTPEGMIPDIAPEYVRFKGGFRDSPEWGSALIINPGFVWQWYADRSPLVRHYDAMKRYCGYLRTKTKDNLLDHGLGDWMPIEQSPMPIVASATWYHDLDLMSSYACTLDRREDAKAFANEAAEVKVAFEKAFWNAEKKFFGTGTQTAQAMPLFFGIPGADRRTEAMDRLLADAQAKCKATGGDVGNRYILMMLAQAGHNDLVYRITCSPQGAYAPQGQQALQGTRTTLAEGWTGGASQNHCMLGHVMEWFYAYLAGIRPAAPGFAQIALEPHPVGRIEWVKAHYDSAHGHIEVHWRHRDGRFDYRCIIPANTMAELRLPTDEAGSVKEGNRPLVDVDGITLLNREPGAVRLRLGSGSYHFSSVLRE